MTEPKPIAVENFSHVCIGVSDMDRSLAFYTDVLGIDVVFDVELEGGGLDAVTGGAAQKGRMVGGLIGGAMVELLFLGDVPASPAGPHRGYTNISFRVADLDDTYQAVLHQHPAVRTEPIVDIGGVRMFFVYDPDDTPIEILELPGGARSTVELWRPGG
ncbi:glyoxalase/bleomycin resistance protein/dioxygenase [Mycobacterium lentiflavum]|uniref:Glyoxalase/bleomycin resistance protein/dioxygenase n=1 Tax=Mycobacterium lentiflavum TaxID=141349 RepID=A0A0E4GZS5_MYCLN|nr:VOC family protein [Mycobacterium lentiflavum]MEE3065094.1 VOC family protein [Actinomycetota bacterium]ULP41176.1 VOC family protein [Mycobacterium lentiflavum]CQD18926.1 glyoxalase/bleomycin resistance protein/dioxygenase [Mycobacterium lentiflavum]